MSKTQNTATTARKLDKFYTRPACMTFCLEALRTSVSTTCRSNLPPEQRHSCPIFPRPASVSTSRPSIPKSFVRTFSTGGLKHRQNARS